jgi:hypothetical protein
MEEQVLIQVVMQEQEEVELLQLVEILVQQ